MLCRLPIFGAVLLASIPAAHAAPLPDADAGGDIIVTAQRRAETIQTVPVAIAAFDENFIDRTRLDDIKDVVTFTPGFSGNSDDSYIDSLAIRGITSNDYGVGGDPSIGIFKDGVYQGRSGSAVTSLYDIDRAEALRGPQGFLFGRNAISGAISIITNKPDPTTTAGHVYLGYASFDRVDAEAAVNLPLADSWALRVAGYATRYDGWVDNRFTPDRNDRLMGGSKQAARASLRYRSDPVDILLSAEHERRRLDGTPYRASNADREVLDYLSDALGQDIVIRGSDRDVDTDLIAPQDRGDISSLTGSIEVDLGFARLTSLTAFRTARFYYLEDYDGTPLVLGNYGQRQRTRYGSQDLRLVSADGQSLTWSAGLSVYREKVRARFTNEAAEDLVCVAGYGYADCDALTTDLYGTPYSPAPGGLLVDVNDVVSRNSGWSLFGDMNYAITPTLTGGLGLRYSRDRKRFSLDVLPSDSSLGNLWTFPFYTDGPVEADRQWAGLSPRLYLRYAPNPDVNVYASLTRGYKAGGFGSFTVEAPAPIEPFGPVPEGTRPDAFAPETLWSKELGVKGRMLNGTLSYDVTAFHYVYRNLQTVFFDTETRTQTVINVGKVTGIGVESSLRWKPSRYFDLSGHVTWTRTRKQGDRDCAAHDCGGLPNPIWSSAGVATIRYPFGADEIYLQGEWSYEGQRRESFDWRGITRRDAPMLVNLRLGYAMGERLELVGYVQNIFDRSYVRGAENGGDLTPANSWGVGQPRSFGIDLRMRY